MDWIYYLLPIILFVGLITSFEDFKYKKIKNIWIMMGGFFGITVIIFLIITDRIIIDKNLVIVWIGGFLVSLLSGFLAWKYDFWSAGDAKLFILYTFLLPPMVYSNSDLYIFSPLNLLINAVIPYFLFSTILILAKLRERKMRTVFFEKVKEKFFTSLIIYFGVFILINELMTYLNRYIQLLGLSLSISILTYYFVNKIQKKDIKAEYVLMIISLIVIFAKCYFDISFFSYKKIIILLVSYLIYRIIIGNLRVLGIEFSTKKVGIKNLKPGMIVTDTIFKRNGKYILKNNKKSFGLLTDENMIFLRNGKNLGFKTLNVKQTVPFAPLLFIGVWITIILEGNVFILIRYF